MSQVARPARRNTAVNAALALVAFALLAWTLYGNRAELHKVLSRPLDPGPIALAFAIYMVGLVWTFYRWWTLVLALGLPFPFRDALRLGFIGNVFNLVIPGAVGGDLVKAAYLSREQSRKTLAISSMIIDRIVGLLGLFMLAAIAGAFAWNRPETGPDVKRLIVMAWCAVGAGFLGLIVIFGQLVTRIFPDAGTRPGKFTGIFNELKEMSSAYRGRLGVVGAAILMSMGNHSLNVTAFYLMGRTLFPEGVPSLVDHFLMVPLTLFTTAVPLPFGALGLTEQVSERLFELVKHPNGALAMLAFRVLMYGGGIVGAFVYLANARQVRKLVD
jgi:uncharacterized membrane protein YbhN (UPF0104 family)